METMVLELVLAFDTQGKILKIFLYIEQQAESLIVIGCNEIIIKAIEIEWIPRVNYISIKHQQIVYKIYFHYISETFLLETTKNKKDSYK